MTTVSGASFRIEIVDEHSTTAALALLKRFLDEEGFPVPQARLAPAFDALWRDPAHHVALACADGESVAVMTVSSQLSIEFGRVAEIGDLYVLPEWRGRGVAAALIAHARAWATGLGCSELQLTLAAPTVPRERLRRYYAARGFRTTGRELMGCAL